MKFTLVFGTESGNTEMVADDVAAALEAHGAEVSILSMADVAVTALDDGSHLIAMTSTYGEGELPESTAPFHAALASVRPDLSNVTFSAFGLGDSAYDTYNNAISIIATTLVELGARLIGEIGRHDAGSGEDPSDVAVAWMQTILATELAPH